LADVLDTQGKPERLKLSRDGRCYLRVRAQRRPIDILHPQLFGTPIMVSLTGQIIDPRWDLDQSSSTLEQPTYELTWQRVEHGIVAAYRHFLHVEECYTQDELPVLAEIDPLIRRLYPLYRYNWDLTRFQNEGVPFLKNEFPILLAHILYVKDPDKVKVRDRLATTMEKVVLDRLGRANPMAFAWRLNGILFRLDLRLDRIANIRVYHAARKAAVLAYWAYHYRILERALDQIEILVDQINSECALPRRAGVVKRVLGLIDEMEASVAKFEVEPFLSLKRMVNRYITLARYRLDFHHPRFDHVAETLSGITGKLRVPLNEFRSYRAELRRLYDTAGRSIWSSAVGKRFDRLILVLENQPNRPWDWLGLHAAEAVREARESLRTHNPQAAQRKLRDALARLWVKPTDAYDDQALWPN